MKKTPRKLELAKETLRNLEEADLSAIAGGWTTSCASVEVICKRPPSDGC